MQNVAATEKRKREAPVRKVEKTLATWAARIALARTESEKYREGDAVLYDRNGTGEGGIQARFIRYEKEVGGAKVKASEADEDDDI